MGEVSQPIGTAEDKIEGSVKDSAKWNTVFGRRLISLIEATTPDGVLNGSKRTKKQ